MNSQSQSNSVIRPDVVLRLEGLLALAAGCFAYAHLYPAAWGFFALLFFTPDVALLPYLLSNGSTSALMYNALHTYIFPLALGLFAWAHGSTLAGQLSLIWMAHISFDRSFGYGRKFSGEFKRTHIQTSASA